MKQKGTDNIIRDVIKGTDGEHRWVEYRRRVLRIGQLPILDNEEGKPAAVFYDEKTDEEVLVEYRSEGGLHRLDGPAVYGSMNGQRTFYRWWGVTIPEEWTKTKPTPKEIVKLVNAEQKQVAIRAIGVENFVEAISTKVVDVDAGVAYRMMVEDEGGDRWIIATDGSTGRTYVMYAEQHATIAEALQQMGPDPSKCICEG